MTKEEALKQKLCMSCGLCCIWMGIEVKPPPKDNLDLILKRGFTLVLYKPSQQVFTYFKYPCPYYTTMGCSIYPARPKMCRNYDGRTDAFLHSYCKWNEIEPHKMDESLFQVIGAKPN